MNRAVTGADGREWNVRGQMEWAEPVTANDFEHDLAARYTPGVFMLCLIVLLGVVLLLWTPGGVQVPAWVFWGLLLLVLFFPLRWAWRRPWTVVAETEGDSGELPAERWVGTVRGLFYVRGEMSRIARSIEKHSLPDFEGPLQPVD
ncbi:hypothetical protein EV191_1011117 [Tamaricihabitans halophyticus]|uniref:DUF983 domain-containing protein n=1 Tax=Tamaricihabitans halophyticus TaxID=1262583 RepID=A0A4R2RCL1_9PSEU|nr:DUF983 domain-containing protein [Tamaricihabitans halophyticus]TCP57165.1 hypothetical protein EV191_1011117 [Tamaricihabitans halophyticus]